MSRELINPDTVHSSVEYGYSHASISEGGKVIHCAGQTAWDKDHNLVGGDDLGAQLKQALANLKEVLAAAGASPANVVRLRTYIVNHTPDKLEAIGAGLGAFYGDLTPAPNTLIGVSALALPDFLVEVEATAVVDN